jgi:hypothetical protein
MSQRTEIYTLTGKKLGVITEGIPKAYTLTGKKLDGPFFDKKNESTDKKLNSITNTVTDAKRVL